jgi:hypothetical protein
MKKGDMVKALDNSYNFQVRNDGTLDHYYGDGLVGKGNLEVIAVDCRLPIHNYGLDDVSPNDIIIKRLSDNSMWFTQERFLELVHRCNCCPKCGEKI